MYFHAHKHIYLTYFNDEIIALDLKNDKYILLSELSEAVYLALNNKFTYKQGQYALVDSKNNCLPDDFDETIEYLREIGILSKNNYNFAYDRTLKKGYFSAGAPNIDWRMPNNDQSNNITMKIFLEAYLSLIQVYFILNVFGFFSLIKIIKSKGVDCIKADAKEFDVLASALNRACFYFPVRTKCLEWSAALTFMGLRRKWKCNMEIGVQNLPFAAHAWVKANDHVIADTQSLPETLSVILSEPFTINE